MDKLSLTKLEISMIRAPQLPVVVTQALRVLNQGEPDFDELVKVISTDPALTGRLISVANSTLMGRRGRASSARAACISLGVNAVRSVVLAIGVVRHLRNASTANNLMVMTEIWAHSFGSAAAARLLAKLTGADPDMAYTAGLLHDIGKIILLQHAGPAYQRVLAYQQEHDCFIAEAEREVLGLDHVVVGSKVVRDWHLPDYLVDAVEHFHTPEQALYPDVTDAVHLGNVLARALELGNPGDDLVPAISPVVVARRNLTGEGLASYFAAIEAAFEEVSELMD